MATTSSQYGECMTDSLTEAALFELLSLVCRVDHHGTTRYFNALGQMHREYGPAIERVDGSKFWYKHGRLHRLDGPAIEYPDGEHEWHINGKVLTEAEWQQRVASMGNV